MYFKLWSYFQFFQQWWNIILNILLFFQFSVAAQKVGLSGLTDAFIENLKLIASTFEGSHRTKVHAASPLGPGQLHTEHVLFISGAVTGSSALALLRC